MNTGLRLIAFVAAVCGSLFISGFIVARPDRMRLTKIERSKGQPFTLVISMPDRDARYRRLYYAACSAEITEAGAYCIENAWFSDGDRDIARSVEPIPFTRIPGGALMFIAAAFDANNRPLASSRLVLMRGW